MRVEKPKRAARVRLVAGRVILGLTTVAALVIMGAGPVDAAVGDPGTNIGNAAQITGSASGSLESTAADDWYVIYPAQSGGTVQFRIKNTTAVSSPCPTVFTEIYNTDGTDGVIDGYSSLSSGASAPYALTGSSRYYVELNTDGCNPSSGAPTSYSLTVVSGGGGKAPNPKARSTGPGTSIGTVKAPLQGDSRYKESLDSGSADAWYVLYKSGSAPATVRIENTTVRGFSNCPTVYTEVHNSDGTDGAVDGYSGQQDDSASTYTFTTAGEYYVEVNLNGCEPGAGGPATYSLEPEPSTGWTAGPAAPAAGNIKPGNSESTVNAPLQGHTLYKESIDSGTANAWYVLHKTGTKPATVRIENTTVRGSTNCPTVYAEIYNGTGGVVDGYFAQQDDSAGTYTFAIAGEYYVEVNLNGCAPGASGPSTYSLEPEPATGWTTPANGAQGSTK